MQVARPRKVIFMKFVKWVELGCTPLTSLGLLSGANSWDTTHLATCDMQNMSVASLSKCALNVKEHHAGFYTSKRTSMALLIQQSVSEAG